MLDSQNPQTQNANGTNEGFTLIEVMVALVIFAFGILAIIGMQTTAIRGGHQSRNLTDAASVGANIIERIVSLDYDHPDIDIGRHTDTINKYTATWDVEVGDLTDTKTVDLTVSWTEGGRTHSVDYEFLKARDI